MKKYLMGCYLAILFGILSLPLSAQNEDTDAGRPARTARRMGHGGLIVWRMHHGTSHQTFLTTASVGRLSLYSSGVETDRYSVGIQRDYPNRLRLEIQIGSSIRILIFDGTTVRAEQGPPPTQSEIDLVLMLSYNSIEWVFSQIDQGAMFKYMREAVRLEDYDHRSPRTFNVFELVLPNRTLLILPDRTSHRIEGIRYRSNGQNVSIEFSDWRSGLRMQLPYRIVYKMNGQRVAELTLSLIEVTLSQGETDTKRFNYIK